MKIYFYGATLKAAEKKGALFVKSLKKAGDKLKGKQVNITRINDPIEADIYCVVPAYKFKVTVEYSIMEKG